MGAQESAVEVENRGHRGMRMARAATAAVQIDASPEEVWETVADIGRQKAWSCEAAGCEWIPPSNDVAPGARFRGHNRRGFRRWTRENEVTGVEAGRLLGWRTLPSRLYPDSTDWQIELSPEGDGTEVREAYQIRSITRGFEIFMYWFNPSHRERSSDLDADLRRLKDYVEGDRR
jgi:uncharacterized protein YndB with AHSA1/START domain